MDPKRDMDANSNSVSHQSNRCLPRGGVRTQAWPPQRGCDNDVFRPRFHADSDTCRSTAQVKLDTTTMLSTLILRISVLAVAVLAPVVCASGPSDKYDPYNSCGAPFCGSTGSGGNVGAAGALVRNSTTDAAKNRFSEVLPDVE
ncbi:uncharacterized protein M421DRAFT_387235 [Didymella exigua CBS 183.55]|uniref:Uncharacterized protein n=1 Tax=Didymella exigua CBS 183.55 TaxID=1150837 RepID=A0A6A5RRF9_9PLEO|nr:uncharacterized protein M421DRAFT_387235 [Didymella exigua CBS 183.55]KAF1930209.1 hypothetical protein M421DRAFT_387235 [Didymella exigua CBS 183.55]